MKTVTQPTGQLSSSRVTRTSSTLDTTGRPGLLSKVLRVLLTVLLGLGIAILALLSSVLVLIPLIFGPTPLFVTIPLAALWIGLLAALYMSITRFHSWRGVLGSVVGFVLLGLLSVVLSQVSAYTPAIVDAQGKPVPGSIASLEKIRLGGSEEWISIRGKSVDNPVLLFLAGGPGGSQLGSVPNTLGEAGIEDHFVVVNWEQPGAGKSFDSVDRSKMTPERYITDAHELILYLNQRFDEQKVYVVGESWGSALGIMLVQRYPELFHAFVGTGQMVDFTECDRLDYEFVLNLAQERGDTAKVEKLQSQGPPPYYGTDIIWKESAFLMDTLNYMNDNPAINHRGNTFDDLLRPEYGLYDKINWVRGPLDTFNYVYNKLWGVDFRKSANKLEVPVYFLIGRHDVNAPVSLTEDYYNVLQAPHKEIVWFEHSGHGPWNAEREKFVDTLVSKVLKDTQATR